jgi:hypothetical protein
MLSENVVCLVLNVKSIEFVSKSLRIYLCAKLGTLPAAALCSLCTQSSPSFLSTLALNFQNICIFLLENYQHFIFKVHKSSGGYLHWAASCPFSGLSPTAAHSLVKESESIIDNHRYLCAGLFSV